MSTAKINIKNIDYFKYRRLVIDGNRDDYAACSRDVKALCDAVQTLSFRDDEFDDSSDRARFDDVSAAYRQIVASKRVDPLDMRLQSGWWGEPGRTARSQSSAGIHTHTHTHRRGIFTPPPIGQRSIVTSVSVCRSVRLSIRNHIFATTCPILPDFLQMLPMAVARSSSGGVLIRYTLAVV